MRSVRGDEAYISDKPRREETEHEDDGIQGLEDHNNILARAQALPEMRGRDQQYAAKPNPKPARLPNSVSLSVAGHIGGEGKHTGLDLVPVGP